MLDTRSTADEEEGGVDLLWLSQNNSMRKLSYKFIVSSLEVGIVCVVLMAFQDRTRGQLWWLKIDRRTKGSLDMFSLTTEGDGFVRLCMHWSRHYHYYHIIMDVTLYTGLSLGYWPPWRAYPRQQFVSIASWAGLGQSYQAPKYSSMTHFFHRV